MKQPKEYTAIHKVTGHIIEFDNNRSALYSKSIFNIWIDTRYKAKLRLYNYLKTKGLAEQYRYSILCENYPELERESTVVNCFYSPKKYALIEKAGYMNGTEKIHYIYYSNNLSNLQEIMKKSISWYDKIAGLKKNIQGYISEY